MLRSKRCLYQKFTHAIILNPLKEEPLPSFLCNWFNAIITFKILSTFWNPTAVNFMRCYGVCITYFDLKFKKTNSFLRQVYVDPKRYMYSGYKHLCPRCKTSTEIMNLSMFVTSSVKMFNNHVSFPVVCMYLFILLGRYNTSIERIWIIRKNILKVLVWYSWN